MITGRINFLAQRNEPNPLEVTYWVDLGADPNGGVIKCYDGKKWNNITGGDSSVANDIASLYASVASLQLTKLNKREYESFVEECNDAHNTLNSTKANKSTTLSGYGVPIGNYLSQFFANLYLSYFDHWAKEEKHLQYYFRYADDIIVLHKDKQFLRDLFKDMKLQIEALKLQFKDNYQIFRIEDRSISFVGYKIYHDYVLIRKNIKHRMCRNSARLCKRNVSFKYYRRKMCSHIGWLKHCNGINLLKKILRYRELLVYARNDKKRGTNRKHKRF